VDKHSALSDKKILTGKLNHLAFNPIHPIIIIGNDRGNVKSFKLSPNLQKRLKPPTDEEKEKGITEKDLEIKKMEDLLASIDRNVY
jgi:dynein intermediate chain 1